MQLACPQCHRVLEFAETRPRFCSFCGKSLPQDVLESTTDQAKGSESPTQPPPAPPAAAVEEDPESVGGYRLLRRLGGGGMGTVYEAEETASGRRVALKLIAAEQVHSAEAVERFRREGRLASAISHPHCVFVLAADEDAGRPYIVMELMPGATLADLLGERARLSVKEAVGKILDVLDGLQEAHRLGVIHRDVKPSNCFLADDGRVKIGDFGLSKSLVGDARLTKTGLFLGTPLFASPEQVRGETVDVQSDLYSLAATLYCLLTGKAPFEGGDLAVTLARLAADTVPPMRTLRPELPPALDKVVLRGLERDRQRRWRDLEQFKQALLPFLPGGQAAAGPGLRFGAYLLDSFLLQLLGMVLAGAVAWSTGMNVAGLSEEAQKLSPQQALAGTALWVLYFGICEWLWGCTPGKRLLRLRVWPLAGGEPPALGRVLLRFVVFYVVTNLGGVTVLAVLLLIGMPPDSRQITPAILAALLAFYPLEILGIGLMLCTMRRRNGWRCLHEFASGTRVVQLPERHRRRALGPRSLVNDVTRPQGLPEQVGPFAVRGALRWRENQRVLLGEDRGLGRQVLLWLRPASEPSVTAERRECRRVTRLRWLAAGQQDDWQWDAFLAPAGRPLADLVAAWGRLSWAEARPILQPLAEELGAAAGDGTLPDHLAVDQVWVQPGGGAQLVEVPLAGEEPQARDGSSPAPQPLDLLAQTAVQALEGQISAPARSIRAPVPEYARRLLDRLLGKAKPFANVGEFKADLEGTRGLPAEVTRSRRAAHVATLAALSSVGLCVMMAPVLFAGFDTLRALSENLREGRRVLDELEVVAARDFVAGVLNPQPLARPAAALGLRHDLELLHDLQKRMERDARELESRREAASGLARGTVAWFEQQLAQQEAQLSGARPARWKDLRLEAWWRAHGQSIDRERDTLLQTETLLQLTVAPLLWVAWAFVCRGGLSYPLLGLSLVRSDGRRAGRPRCAWRGFLVWAPLTALVLTAVALAGMDRPFTEGDTPQRWALWLTEVFRWTSVGLLVVYAVLAIGFPQRSLHDRLAGTYLVPR
jgi:hypothetical protein